MFSTGDKMVDHTQENAKFFYLRSSLLGGKDKLRVGDNNKLAS